MRLALPLGIALLCGCQPAPSGRLQDSGMSAYEPGEYGMYGFSWVLDGVLAGLPQPGAMGPLALDLAFLGDQGVDLLVSANHTGVDPMTAAKFGLDYASFPVDDFQAPTLAQMVDFAALADERIAAGDAVAVHCTAGKGRTGTYLAVYLVSTGMSAEEAIAEVRLARPGSIETISQEEAIATFARSLDGDTGR